jgi:hypothetical protein
MLLKNTSKNLYKSRPCFYPWQDFDISYDAIIGLSLTLVASATCDIYLTYYKKSKTHIELIFCNDAGDIVAKTHAGLNEGINTVDLIVNKPVLSGKVTVINTVEDEESSSSVKVSHNCIVYAAVHGKNDYIRVNGDKVPASNVSLNFGSGVDVITTSDGKYCDIMLSFTNTKPAVISTDVSSSLPNYFIRYVNNTIVPPSGEYIVELPENFSVKKVAPHMAIITDTNTYKNRESKEIATYHPELPEGIYNTERTPLKEIAVYNEETEQYKFSLPLFDAHLFGKNGDLSGWQLDAEAEASYGK